MGMGWVARGAIYGRLAVLKMGENGVGMGWVARGAIYGRLAVLKMEVNGHKIIYLVGRAWV